MSLDKKIANEELRNLIQEAQLEHLFKDVDLQTPYLSLINILIKHLIDENKELRRLSDYVLGKYNESITHVKCPICKYLILNEELEFFVEDFKCPRCAGERVSNFVPHTGIF